MSLKVDLIAGYGKIKGKQIMILKGSKPHTLIFMTPLIAKEQYYVTDIRWNSGSERSGSKAALGAAAGGVLAGPLGLLLGAAAGAKKKDTSTASIKIDIDQGDAEILIKCTAKEYEQLRKLLY